MDKIISYFGLDKQGYSQANVEFLNVRLDKDNSLFVDHNKVLKFKSTHTANIKISLDQFLAALFSYLKFKKRKEVVALLSGLHECNPTKLGMSKNRPRGNSVGKVLKKLIQDNAQYVIDALATGQFSYDAFYFGVDQVGPDRISDIVVSIIKPHLIKFTQEQCAKHSIPLKSLSVKNSFDPANQTWKTITTELPIYDGQPVIFLPKQYISSAANLNSGFDRFLRYGFHNFVKDNPEYKFLLQDKKSSVRKKDYDAYLQENDIKGKDEVKKWVRNNNTAIIDFQSDNDQNIVELTPQELDNLIDNQ